MEVAEEPLEREGRCPGWGLLGPRVCLPVRGEVCAGRTVASWVLGRARRGLSAPHGLSPLCSHGPVCTFLSASFVESSSRGRCPPCDIHLMTTGVEGQRRWRLAQSLALGTDAEHGPGSTLCDVTFETTSPGLEGPGPSTSLRAGGSRPAAILAFAVSSMEDSMEILRIGETME